MKKHTMTWMAGTKTAFDRDRQSKAADSQRFWQQARRMLLRWAWCTCRQLLKRSYQRISDRAPQSRWPTEFALAFRANATDDRSEGLLVTAEFQSITTTAF